MKAQTDHIQACRNAWLDHRKNCKQCYFIEFYAAPIHYCEQGRVIYDEYCSAITANRDCEMLEAKEPTCQEK